MQIQISRDRLLNLNKINESINEPTEHGFQKLKNTCLNEYLNKYAQLSTLHEGHIWV